MVTDVSKYIEHLRSDDAAARMAAVQGLAALGENAAPAATALVEVCASDDEELCEMATGVLEEIGPPPTEQLSKLIELVGRPEQEVAYWAATLIGRLEGTAAIAETALARALETHGEPAVRERAAWALGRIGKLSVATRAALQRAAESGSPRLARLASAALAQGG